MSTDAWMTVSQVAELARRTPRAVRHAATEGALGPLAERLDSPRGAYWLLHPALADPHCWACVVGPTGPRPAGMPAVRDFCLAVMAASVSDNAWRHAAETIHGARTTTATIASRVAFVWRTATGAGLTQTAELLDLLAAALAEAGEPEG